MEIINLTRPDQEPQGGDLVRYIYPDGTIVEKHIMPKLEIPIEEIADQERQWRDGELASTDFIVPLVDHPKHSVYMAYRQELRDYPNQADFPNGTRPVKP
jgi:hypothetical protein